MKAQANYTPPRYLTAAGVHRLLGISDTTLRRLLLNVPDFPKPLRTTPGPAGHRRWIESEVIEWMESQREVSAK